MLETSTAPDSGPSRVELPTLLSEAEVLTFEPKQLATQLISRRQQLARSGGQGGDRQTLESEVDILTRHGKRLSRDAFSPNLADVGTRIKDVERRLSEGGLGSNEQIGLRIRLRLLKERKDWLHNNGPVIASREASEWKAEKVHNGAALPLDQWEYVSPKLVANPDAELNDREEYRRYIHSLDTHRRRDVAAVSAQMEPIGDRVRVVVCMPAYKEGDNIRTTLNNFLEQRNLDGSPFDYSRARIVVVDNWPEGGRRDKTGAEVRKFIAQAKGQHPGLQIDYVKAVMSGKGRTIGNIRNIAAAGIIDSAKDRSKDAEDLIYVSHDADMPRDALRKDYLATVIDEFDTHPRMDAMAGKIDFPRELMARTPVQFAIRRLWQFSDIALMLRYNKEPFLVGRNSAMRLKMLAAVGNYDSSDSTGEDVEIGNKIKWARSWVPFRREFDRRRIRSTDNSADNRVRHSNRAVLLSDPRRDLMRLMAGSSIRDQYTRFVSDQSVRGKSGAELADVAVQKGHGVFDKARFEREAAAFYYHAKRHASYGSLDDFRRAMRMLGAKWTVKNGRFAVTDTSILERGIQKAQREEGVAVSERNAIPFDTGNLEVALGSQVRSAVRVTIGKTNTVFKARMVDGKDVFIRVGRVTSHNGFGAEKWASKRLIQLGVPAPDILLADNKGEVIDGKAVSVSVAIDGAPIPSRKAERHEVVGKTFYRQVGRALRKIHSVPTKKFGYINERGVGHDLSWKDFVSFQIERASRNISPEWNVSGLDIAKAIGFFNSNKGTLDAVQPRLLHGDPVCGNMLSKNRRLAGIIDLEAAMSGDPLWDIARFAVLQDQTTSEEDLRQLLIGYGDSRLIESPENKARYNMYRLAIILNTAIWHQTRGEGATEQNRTFIANALRKVLKDL